MKISGAKQNFPAYDPVHLLGIVQAMADGRFDVYCDGGNWICRLAASCLLAPRIGDTVLISGPDPARVYLIAVIEQADSRTARIEVPGKLVLASLQGAVALEAGGDIELQAGARLRMRSAQFSLQARQADCVVDDMNYVGQGLNGTVTSLRLFAQVCETVAERLTSIARNAFRAVSGIEHVRSGAMDYEAETTVRVHAPYTVVTGSDLVKVDAKQIHMG